MNKIPLGELDPTEFCDLVAKESVRPERPDAEDACNLTDNVWELAEKCWVGDPKRRPMATTVCDILSNLCDAAGFSEPTHDPLHVHVSAPPLSLTVRAQPIPSHALTPPSSLTLRGYKYVASCALFSPGGKLVFSGSNHSTVRGWNAQTGDPAPEFLSMGPYQYPASITLSSNGGRIAIGFFHGGFAIWNVEMGQEVITCTDDTPERIGNYAIIFSPDDKRIASCSAGDIVQIQDAETGVVSSVH